MVLVAVCATGTLAMTQPLLDEIFFSKNKQKLLELAAIMLSISTVKGIAEFFQNYLVKSIGQKILTDLQMLLFDHLLHADLALIQSESSGKLISRFTNDILLMRGAVSTLIVGLARHFLSVVFLIIMMFRLEPRLSTIIFIAFPLSIYPIQYLGRRMRKIVYQTQDKLGEYTAKLDEVFLSIKVVKSYHGEDFELQKAKRITDEIYKLYKKATKFDALTSPITEFLSGLAIAGILIYGGLSVINGTSTASSLLTFIAAFFSAYRPFKSMLVLNVNLQEGVTASRRLFEILDTKPEVHDREDSIECKFTSPDINFKNVYLTLNEKCIFENLSLHILSGKTTAIVGSSGGGKTSIINLLLKFYQPNSGQILIEDKDISNIKSKSLRNQIALVTQETFLFDMSIWENIAYTTPATKDEVIAAAQKASAHDFIMKLPNGYDTIIGFQGYSLSGGQKQRLSLARAFLKKAPILILDEATSSLDSHNENMIFESLKTGLKNLTTIIITHRLASIKDVDNIIVINHGRIIEEGNHEQLMANQNEYYQLYERQAQNNQALIPDGEL
jgi:subfamily B ATP-binding cassette protein MsbA